VVEISANLFKLNVISLGDFLRDCANRERDLILKQGFAVFDGKDNVVVRVIGIVMSADEGHAASIPLETEGFQTFLQGSRGKPRGNPLRGLYHKTKTPRWPSGGFVAVIRYR